MDGKNISVKAHLDHEDGSSEVRRFGLDSSAATSFTYLQGKLRLAFPSLLRQPMEVTWLDGDQDWVTLSTDEELLLALTDTLQVRTLDTLRLKVAPAALRRQPVTSSSELPVHTGVCCDVCNQTIRGCRYKCLTCDDFDLCATCEAETGHPEHVMVRISSPELAWQRYVRPGRRGGWRGPNCGRAGGAAAAAGTCPGKGRGRHQGKSETAAEAGKASSSNGTAGPSSGSGPGQTQRPKNFFDAINAAMTALGGFPAEASAASGSGSHWSEQSLHDLGQKIAACLDPFGIDVDVGVEPRQKTSAGRQKPEETKEPERQTPAAASPEQQQGTPAAASDDVSMEAEAATQIPITVDENEPTDDWTVVSDDSTQPPAEEAGARPRVYPSLASEVVAAPSADTTPAPPSAPTADETLQPRIQRALDVMTAMGFSNDGGWLTQLLEAKQGDIAAVLDVLQPVRPRQPQTY